MLPTSAALRTALLRIYALAAGLTVLAGGLLFAVGFNFSPDQAWVGLGVIAPLAFVPMLLVDVWALLRQFAPLGALLRHAHTTAPVPPAIAAAGLAQAFNLPALTFLRVLLVHVPSFGVPATVLFGVANQFGLGFEAWQIAMFWLTLAFLGVGHAIFEYFAVARLVRPVVVQLQARVGGLPDAARARIWPVSVRRKLLLVSVFVVFVPLVVLSATLMAQMLDVLRPLTADPLAEAAPLMVWAAILTLASTLVMGFMAVLMAQDVAESAETLRAAMARVQQGDLTAHVPVSTSDEFASLYEGFNRMADGLRERERLRDAFGRYVAPELAEQVMKHGVQLGGQTVTATVLFADIRGFTTIAEALTPEAVVTLLNEYFAAVEPAIQARGGWINKFGGDSLLAVFGTPVNYPDHARRAVQAALDMRAALAVFNRRREASGQPPLAVGMGLHTGPLVAGNVGSPTRMEYTVIGDIVNAASRIDGLNKDWHTDILLSADTFRAAGGDFPARAMPPVALKGKTQTIAVFALD